MVLTSLILDLVVLAIFVGCAVYYGKKGFIASLLDFLGTLISLVGAYFLGQKLSAFLFGALFRDKLVENTLAVLQDSSTTTLSSLLKEVLGFLPTSVVESLAQSHGDVLGGATTAAATSIVDTVIAPVITQLIGVVVFFVIFLVLRLVIGYIASLFKNVTKVPLLGAANGVLGIAVGLLLAVLYTFLLIAFIWLIDGAYGEGMIALKYFDNSFVYKLLSGFNFNISSVGR